MGGFNKNSDNQEFIKKLELLRDLEAEKPVEEMDVSLVKACVELILELRGETVNFTPEEVEEKVRKIPFVEETKIAGLVHEAGKAAIIVVNKWDAVEDKETNTMRDMEQKVRQDLAYMTYAPVMFLSALTGQRVSRLFPMIQEVAKQNSSRITTGALNSVLADATARVQPPTDKGRRLKIYYMTQASSKPPHFVIFCNDARLFHFSYQRYLENQIREVFGLQGTPIRITIRQKGDKEE